MSSRVIGPYSKTKGTYRVEWYTKEVMAAVSEMTRAEEYEASKRVFSSAKKFVPIGKILRLNVTKDWMRRVPGTLKSSIKLLRGRYGGRLVWAGGMIMVYYAHFVEFGTIFTKKRSGERFMRKAINAERTYFLNSIKRNLEG